MENTEKEILEQILKTNKEQLRVSKSILESSRSTQYNVQFWSWVGFIGLGAGVLAVIAAVLMAN